ncbi:MAG: carboxypeptidase-like regulatory domain-containing protein [Bacteroidota bacterium]
MNELIKQYLIAVCICLISLEVTGQNSYRVSGKISSATTKEPLAFSTINIAGTSEGVVTNFLGAFEFTFSSKYANDTLFVSMLGFKPKKIAIGGLALSSVMDIQLKESIVMLEEIEVSEKKLSALEIVTKVIDNIPVNYPDAPYLLHGFTRSHKHECGKYIKLYEADFEVYGVGYHKKTPEKVYVNEARQSEDVPYYHSRVLRANSNPFNSMGHINDVLFRSYSLNTKSNQYVIDNYLIDDDDLIYVIKTNHSKYVTHTMYINSKNYALIKVKMEMTTPEGEEWNPYLNKGISSDSLDFKVTQIVKTIQFERKRDRYYSKYMDWLIKGILSFQESKKEFCDWGFRFETMFNEIVTKDVTRPSREKLLNFRSQKQPKSTQYNTVFWDTYPLVKEFPITSQIIEDLQINGSLEDQFKKTANK